MAVQEVDYLWLSGRMVPWQDAAVHPLTHALHYGSGVFEGIRCYETEHGPGVFRLTDHLRRLQRSAKLYYLDSPFELEELRRAVFEVIGANDLRSCYVRPLVFRGTPTWAVTHPRQVCAPESRATAAWTTRASRARPRPPVTT
jgi:branched-chain amino acid aminotransferase